MLQVLLVQARHLGRGDEVNAQFESVSGRNLFEKAQR